MENSGICKCVGASVLAMDVNDVACDLCDRVVLAFLASKLAPTGIGAGHWAQAPQNGGYLKAKRRPLAAV
ncbi:hypothetical protein DOZ80_06890 [Pseudomonas fluorescens]|uniref:Uncharacterized protein n=1 Tax=Pseudomonas fluorescens TaxID=294 RepID=A0A327N9K7_PSEFL|nr:hypothetical protein DOZ80_06890 [Pseudomonas fluorescens]